MKLDSLEIGMVVKNYKELCRLLELKPTTGRGRQNQMAWIEDYVKYEKQGYKFIIKDIYNDIEIVPMRGRGGDTSDNTHIKYIEKLVLDMLVQDKKGGEIFLSKSKIFEALDMVNVNYGYCSARTNKLAKLNDMHVNNVEEWFTSTSGMLERSLNKALNRLESQSLIFWSKVITVHEVAPIICTAEAHREVITDPTGEETEKFTANVTSTVKESTREATKDEVRFIIRTEREVMREMGCEGKQQIMAKKKWSEFQRRVKEIILKEINIGRYWHSYSIVYNSDHVKEGADKLSEKLLPYEDRDEYKMLLNMVIKNNSNTNSKNRHERSKKQLEDVDSRNKGRNQRRADTSYLEDSERLGDSMIERNAPDIKNEVKAINPYKNYSSQ